MKSACFIPIKSNSERVPGKNLRFLGEKKLYQHVIDTAIAANVFDDIYIDTDSFEIQQYALESGIKFIERKAELSSNNANGNDLLVHQYKTNPNYDLYYQIFVTSPFLSVETIKNCVKILKEQVGHDSIMTVIPKQGFFWYAGVPINYRPGIMPRTQDMQPVYEETVGVYGIRKESLERYRCRVGYNPFMYEVNHREAIDIDTEEDFQMAEIIANQYTAEKEKVIK